MLANGFKLGERFLKIAFDNAIASRVNEIYVTIFRRSLDQERLFELLGDWGFRRHGVKSGPTGTEEVLVRDLTKEFNRLDPRATWPFFSTMVPIYYSPDLSSISYGAFSDSIYENGKPQRICGEPAKSKRHKQSIYLSIN